MLSYDVVLKPCICLA